MNANEEAAIFDRQDQPAEAAHAYETAITNSEADLNTYINLAVLYFVCQDFGYAAHHNVPDAFRLTAWDRAGELLDGAKRRFGSQPEIDFWRRYFAFAFLGDPPFYPEAERLAQTGRTLVPYLHLITGPRPERYRQQATKLLESVNAGLTARERYIKSVVESALSAGSSHK